MQRSNMIGVKVANMAAIVIVLRILIMTVEKVDKARREGMDLSLLGMVRRTATILMKGTLLGKEGRRVGVMLVVMVVMGA
jgi:hypothetical protein